MSKITDVGAVYDPQWVRVGGNEGVREMTHEEMVVMAREAGLGEHTNYEYEQIWELKNVEALERFAALVTAAERERCARVCERVSIPYENTSSEAAAAIRKGE